ncbi:MAG: hypothetical protein RI601_08830 [Desulfurivibrionaceae bacterium]|nr:hypothetical protein [Desulfurivibrionaceae bacterium]
MAGIDIVASAASPISLMAERDAPLPIMGEVFMGENDFQQASFIF